MGQTWAFSCQEMAAVAAVCDCGGGDGKNYQRAIGGKDKAKAVKKLPKAKL